MGYNFGDEIINSNSSDAGKMTQKSYDKASSTKTSMVNNSRVNPDIEEQLIFGQNILGNPVPSVFNGIVRFPGRDSLDLSKEILSKHLLMLGGIGCGKTNTFNFLIDQISKEMSHNDVMFIFDTKGDFRKQFYTGNSRQLLIGNDEKCSAISGHWNIFDELLMPDGTYDKNICDINAREMAKQLFMGHESETQPFFSNAAIDIFAKILIFFMREAKPHDRNNENLVSFLKGAPISEYIKIMNRYPDFRSALMYFGDGTSDQALGVFGNLSSIVEELFIGIFAKKGTINNLEFSMRDLVRNPRGRQVFIEYDLRVGEVLGPLYRVLFDQALIEALGRKKDASNAGNVYMIVDEFKLLPQLTHIDDGLNFGRSLGVKICAGLQSISQLNQIYGKDRADVIASGFMNAFCFNTSDKPSREFIKDRFGKKYSSFSYYDGSGKPVFEPREGNVVEDWDILKLDTGEAFIDLNGYDPFKYKFPKYV